MCKTEIVSARLHKATKQKLLETGYNTAEILEWFSYAYFHMEGLQEAIPRDMLKMKLENLRNNKDNLKKEIKSLEEVLMTD